VAARSEKAYSIWTDFLTPMQGMIKRVHTSSLEVAYEERGSPRGQPIILVHGFPDDVRTWDGVVGPLVDAGYRTLTPYVRGFGPTRFLDKATPRSGQLTALGQDLLEFADALQLGQFMLVGHDWGARAAYTVSALWPGRVRGLVILSAGYGTSRPQDQISYPQARAYWYQWYFGLERGRASLEQDRRGLCRWLWETWSPGWRFDPDTFEATARSFDNPDFVEISIHSYRHRWGNAPGDPRYEKIEARMASLPPINVPTTVIHGADDGATLPETSAGKERHFARSYERHLLPGVGHFVQRERPGAVVEAVLGRLRT
jgi:pimeloyl-ACP methyl ester carboxylesterase